MLNEIERVISYIAACLIHNKKFYHIYALENNKYFDYSFSGYNVYDYSRECFCSISKLSPSKYNIFDYKIQNFITLDLNGNNFSGYDYKSSSFYNGVINNNIITFFSYKTGKYTKYLVS